MKPMTRSRPNICMHRTAASGAFRHSSVGYSDVAVMPGVRLEDGVGNHDE